MTERKKLPSIQMLAIDAWELFKKTWISYLKLILLQFAYIFLALLIGILISLPITFGALGSGFRFFYQMTPFHIATLLLFILWLILFIISLIAIGIIFPVAGIFILQGKKISPIFTLIKTTKQFFWPYFFTILLDGFLIIGGMFLFVLPGFLIGLFFSFVSYEVVVEGNKGLWALKRSYFIVKNNFWEVFGRVIVFVIAANIVSFTLHRLASGNSLLGLGYFFFTLFLAWYARAYTFILYKEVRARTIFPTRISINWIWIVSVIGWVVFILLTIGLAVGLMHLPGYHHQMNQNSASTV